MHLILIYYPKVHYLFQLPNQMDWAHDKQWQCNKQSDIKSRFVFFDFSLCIWCQKRGRWALECTFPVKKICNPSSSYTLSQNAPYLSITYKNSPETWQKVVMYRAVEIQNHLSIFLTFFLCIECQTRERWTLTCTFTHKVE